jgi:hypothetical protein
MQNNTNLSVTHRVSSFSLSFGDVHPLQVKNTTQLSKALLSKKSNAGGITIRNFKLYYKAIAMKTSWYWHKNRHEDQWIRIEDPDMNPHSYTHLIFDKGDKNTRWRKDNLFNNSCWGKWFSVFTKLKLDPCLSPVLVSTQSG